jgi:hypothetical protein
MAMAQAILEIAMHYRFTVLCLLAQLSATEWPRKVLRPATVRPPSDPAWFVPIFVWGIESVRHAHWSLFERPVEFPYLPDFAGQAGLSGLVLALVLAACFFTERRAGRQGLAARAPQVSLPLPVVAAILGAHWCWSVLGIAFISLPG